jgi:hypothetical protein
MKNKHLLYGMALVFSLLSFFLLQAQPPAAIPIPMKNGIVFYEKQYALPKALDERSAAALALSWIKKTFPGAITSVLTEGHTRTVYSKGSFKVPVSTTGNYYWIRMKISLSIQDGSYVAQLSDYYEKPIEKGVSNEYSKIEYRWWDFRQGKPWSPEDSALFEGIHQQTLVLMDSLASVLQ